MIFRRYAKRGIRAGIEVTAEKQHHYQFKYKTDGWHTGYMESLHDTTHVRHVTNESCLFRGVTRRVFHLHFWLGWFCIEFSIITPFKVDPNWDELGGIETPLNEVSA